MKKKDEIRSLKHKLKASESKLMLLKQMEYLMHDIVRENVKLTRKNIELERRVASIEAINFNKNTKRIAW